MTASTHNLPPGDWRLAVYGGTRIVGTARRNSPRLADRQRILADQDDICLYCQIPIGAVVIRKGRDVVLRRNWDHFVPYAYVARNPGANWVLACHICNTIKGPRMFDTVQQARDVILPRREAKGYSLPLMLRKPAAVESASQQPAAGTDG